MPRALFFGALSALSPQAGWINHTIDFVTGDYLGQQGYFPYGLKGQELDMMKEWNITLLGQ